MKFKYFCKRNLLQETSWTSKEMQMPPQGQSFSGLGNDSQADEPSFSPVGSQMLESSTHQIADSQPPEASSVPGLCSQTDQSYSSSDAAQESQHAEDCLPPNCPVQEKQTFVKEEIASLAPVPSVGDHYVYSESNYFSESTESSNHPSNEKGNLKIFTETKAYMPNAVQHVINHYNLAAFEDLEDQNTAPVPCPPLWPGVVVKFKIGFKARKRELPTEEGYTHDFKVYIRGVAGCAIEHFVSTVAFRLPLNYPRPIRARREPPYEINVSGCAKFPVDVYIYFRSKGRPFKFTQSYDINLFLSANEVRETRWIKLIFQNPGLEFERKLLLGGGEPCGTIYTRNDLATSAVQSQECDTVTAGATRSTVRDGILTVVYDDEQIETFLSPADHSLCESDLRRGPFKEMLDFYMKVFKNTVMIW